MIVSRGKVSLAFLGIYLVLGFLTGFGSSERKEWTIDEQQLLREAACIAGCLNNKSKVLRRWSGLSDTSKRSCETDCDPDEHPEINSLELRDNVGPASFNASLKCRDIDQIVIEHTPGVWVFELSTRNGSWERTIGSLKKSYRSTCIEERNLSADTLYRFKAYRVTANGDVSEPETTPWFRTFEMGHRSEKPKNVRVVHQVRDKENIGRAQANIIIEPASDHSCVYDIFSWIENGKWDSQLGARPVNHEWTIRNLDFKTNVTIFVSARNAGDKRSSNNYSLSFTTPLCAEKLDDAHSNGICAGDVDLSNTTSGSWSAFTEMKNAYLHDGIIVFLALAILFLVLGLAYAFYLQRHSKGKGIHKNKTQEFRYNISPATNGSEQNLECTYLESQKESIPTPIDRFEIRPDKLKIKGVLGRGAYGIVRLGRYRISEDQGINVAVKTIKDNPNGEDIKNFRREISIMKFAGNHRNIVSIIGCCTIDVASPMLVVEYCSQGDLQTYLRTFWKKMMTPALGQRASRKVTSQEGVTFCIQAEQVAIANKAYDLQDVSGCTTGLENISASDNDDISVANLLSFAWQVACGMEFLSSNRIIHRDLAARNVLVCADKTVKISDFGLSRDIYEENAYKKQGNSRLPLKWMALEALTHQIYTSKSDVWSFGILLWEIVTLGCNPYPGIPTDRVLGRLKTGYRMEKPNNCGDELYDIMRPCWRSRPHSRPNFTELKNHLDRLLQTVSENQYLKLYDVLQD